MSELHINGNDLLKIKNALEEGRAIAEIRVRGGRFAGGGVATFTMTGRGWTVYANIKR